MTIGGVNNDDPNLDDDFDIPFDNKTIVFLKKMLNKKMVLTKTILVQMTILNNLAHSIVMIKSIKVLITMWSYPLNFPLG